MAWLHSLAHVVGDTFLSLDFGKLMGSRGGGLYKLRFAYWSGGGMAAQLGLWCGLAFFYPFLGGTAEGICEHSSLFSAHLRATIEPEVHAWPVVLSLG